MSSPDNTQKWQISALSALIFLIISSPFLYKITNVLGEAIGYPYITPEGCPTLSGLLVHALVFMLVTRLLMGV